MSTSSTRPFRVTVADVPDHPALEALWPLFRHDLSALTGTLPDTHGRFRRERLDAALHDPSWQAFLFRLGTAPTGFAFVRRAGAGLAADLGVGCGTAGAGPHVMNSFFVVRGARRQGFGRTAARAVIERLPGAWRIPFQPANVAAAAFWRALAADLAPGRWSEELRPVPGRPDLPADAWILLPHGHVKDS